MTYDYSCRSTNFHGLISIRVDNTVIFDLSVFVQFCCNAKISQFFFLAARSHSALEVGHASTVFFTFHRLYARRLLCRMPLYREKYHCALYLKRNLHFFLRKFTILEIDIQFESKNFKCVFLPVKFEEMGTSKR